jgi:hypothetical protein
MLSQRKPDLQGHGCKNENERELCCCSIDNCNLDRDDGGNNDNNGGSGGSSEDRGATAVSAAPAVKVLFAVAMVKMLVQ